MEPTKPTQADKVTSQSSSYDKVTLPISDSIHDGLTKRIAEVEENNFAPPHPNTIERISNFLTSLPDRRLTN
jgi:phage FluMu gp28-like protein